MVFHVLESLESCDQVQQRDYFLIQYTIETIPIIRSNSYFLRIWFKKKIKSWGKIVTQLSKAFETISIFEASLKNVNIKDSFKCLTLKWYRGIADDFSNSYRVKLKLFHFILLLEIGN